MGGYGSGRQGWRANIEAQRRIDVRLLRKLGALRIGCRGVWTWSQNGEQVGWVPYEVTESAVQLHYTLGGDSGDSIAIRIVVPLQTVSCRYGGSRAYFLCPHCSSRCEVIVMTTSDMNTAKTLGLTIPQSLLVRADEVIQ